MRAASRVPSVPARILVVRLGAIGDVVNALVLATAIKDAAPGTHIGWAVHPLSRPLVQGHPAIDAVHVWRKGGGLSAFRDVLGEVRAARYDLAIDAQRILKSALLARLSGAERVLGFGRDRAKEASWILTGERLQRRVSVAHMVEHYLDFAGALGLANPQARFELPNDGHAVASAERWVREFGAAPIALHIGATKPANRWPLDRWRQLAARLADGYGDVVCFTGGPAEREAAEELQRSVPSAKCLAGRTSLLELAELLRRSRLLISCDSGPMHLAGAVGCPVVALFGAADERRTGPYGEAARVVRTRPPCAPCGRKHCNQPSHLCMDELSVDSVLAAVNAQLGRAR